MADGRPRAGHGADMMTPAELAASFTDLDEADFDHLQRLLGSWGVLSDLSFSDLLLLVPTVQTPLPPPSPRLSGAGLAFVVFGQMRPTTSQTLFQLDLVGKVVSAQELPTVLEAWRTLSLIHISYLPYLFSTTAGVATTDAIAQSLSDEFGQ